jgi:hypothetical protein
MRPVAFVLLLLLSATGAQAQSEEALRQYFEGKRVVVHQDMPATQLGADVTVDRNGAGKMAFDAYSRNLRNFGVSVPNGATAMVTKVKVKGDMIEFQLDGGGYGVFGDITDPTVGWTPKPKSDRERELERQLDYVRDRHERDRITDELNDLRHLREGENNRRRREAEAQTRMNADRIAEKRQTSGSRLNLRFPAKLMPDDLRPDVVVRALADYVTFPWLAQAPPPGRPASVAPHVPAPPPVSASNPSLRKGMTQQEVERLLGQPRRRTEKLEGSLKLQVLTYETVTDVIEAQYLDGVLVKYSVSSK